MEITQELLHELFEYKDGELYWKVSPTRNIKAGKKAGHLRSDGYFDVSIKGKLYLCHRIIFLMFNGYLPKYIDHINNKPGDNRIENLRECTPSQNNMNSKLKVNNTSGYKNIHWYSRYNKWQVQLRVGEKRIHFGYFDDLELAKLVAEEARIKYYGDFANHG